MERQRQGGGPLIRADERRYPHGAVTADVIGAFYDVYNELGRGFVEAVYRRAMAIALADRGMVVDVEAPLTVRFRGVVVGAFRADLVVAGASGLEIGLLLNFGPTPTVRRFAFTHTQTPASP